MDDVDVTRPNIARVYDYLLGGKDHFDADRDAAEALRAVRPDMGDLLLDNKKFLTRAVTYVAEQGVRQFLDIGSGLPTSSVREEGAAPLWLSIHEAARAVEPGATVVYVDYDPVAVLHSRVLLDDGSGHVAVVEGDMRDPGAIVNDEEIRSRIDLGAPVCVILGCVLHFLNAGTAQQVAAGFTGALAPGSYVIISVGYGEGQAGKDVEDTYTAQNGPAAYNHSRQQIAAFFGDLELVPPGLVDAATWQPGLLDTTRPQRAAMILAGVGHRT